MSRPFGLAMVGLGMAAKPHARALQALSDKVAVRGAYARTADRRAQFQAQYGFPVCDDLPALAARSDVDAALIVTPPNARKEIVSLFAAHGKHILSEKPLERDLAGAKEIVKICKKAGVQLGVVFQHRFREASQRLANLLASRQLGAIRLVRADIPWWRDQSYYNEPGRGSYARDGGGVLISQAIHTLDLMLALAGPVRWVQAACTTNDFHQMEAENVAAGALMFENGAMGSLFASTACYPGQAESLQLFCEHASATLKSGTLTLAWHNGAREILGTSSNTGGGADPMDFPFDWHQALISNFVEQISAGGSPAISGEAALQTHALIEALERSSKKGRRIKLRKV